jgi:hypothetical protein
MWASEGHAGLVMSVLRRQLDYYNRNVIITGGRSADDLIASLRKAGAPRFAGRVEDLITESRSPG